MKSFHVSPDQRQHIIQEARHVLSDGTPRTAFQLAQAFQHRGRLPSVGTLAITTVLTTTPDFRYDTASDCFRLTAGLRPAGGPALTPTSPAPPPASAPPAPRFQRMQRIRLRAQPQRQGRIIDDPQHYSHGYQYFVTLSGDHEGWFAEHDLEELPLDGLPIWQSTEAFLRDLALIKQQARFTDGLYAYKASRTEFVPYQFRPVLKFLRNMHHRILIADEVGLGKTIEAALIYLELKARLNISRVLILCPSRLKAKWQDELRYRFEEDFVDLDSQAIRRFLDDTQRMGHTFPFKAIASFETMRSPAFIQAWSELHIPLDLLIVDEAHYLRNQETNTYELGLTLSDLADAVVFLTATPLHLGNQDLFNLLHILLPGDFPNRDVFTALIEPNTMINRAAALIGQGQLHEARRVLRSVEATSIQDRFLYNPYYHEILAQLGEGGSTRREQLVLKQDVLDLNTLSTVFTRTRKREVSQAAVRAAYSLEVQLNPHERAFYDAVLQHVQRELRQRFGKTPPFAMVMRERQAASCLIALREAILEAHQSPLDLRIEASTFDDHTDRHSDSPPTTNLLRLAQQIGHTDSKYDLFRATLTTLIQPSAPTKILVFSFFRRTLEYLRRRLRHDGYTVALLNGDVPVADRKRVIEEFRTNPEYQIMLSSEVGAEGLDFQFCSTLVNYDLPWNPMQVEQRIGRLDRFGQMHERIRIYNFYIEETIETRIFQRLYERIGIFEQSIGELEAILGQTIRTLSEQVLQARLTPREQQQLVDQEADRILRLQQEQDQYDAYKEHLLVPDQFFTEQVREMVASGRYLSGNELCAVVTSYLTECHPRVRFERDPDEATWGLRLDDALLQQIQRHTGVTDHGTMTRFYEAHQQKLVLPLTFDSDLARQRARLEFITINHILARTAIAYWQSKPHGRVPALNLHCPGPREETGHGYFFIYQFTVHGAEAQSLLKPIILLSHGQRAPHTTQTLFQRLTDAPMTAHHPLPPQATDEFLATERQASTQIAVDRDELQATMQRRNTALRAAHQTSIRTTFDAKIARARDRLHHATDERIARMKTAEIRNLEAKKHARLEELATTNDVHVSHRLVAGGAITIYYDAEHAIA